MKEDFDKGIDSLLRRHGGAAAEARAVGEGARAAPSAAHLDADELSAFAEGALPPPARLAAVSHLADCGECRGLVVGLSRAAGMGGELEKRAAATQVEPARPARSRVWLSALFAPRVLRYVAPAVALCLVAAVSFVALRSRRGNEELARRASSEQARRGGAARVEEQNDAVGGMQSSNANVSVNVGDASSDNANANAQDEAAANAPAGAPRVVQGARGPNAEGETETVTAEEPKRGESTPPPATDEKKEAAVSAALAPKPAANEPSEAAKNENKEKGDRVSVSQEQVASNDQAAQQSKLRSNQQRNLDIVSPDDSRNQTRSATNNASGGASSNGARSGALASTPREDRDKTERGSDAPATRRAGSADKSSARTEDDEVARSEETRGVAGHRFRRVGGAWVDVNYKSSMPSTGVHRGTDAYRALVADIPEVGRVAEQLGGEVIVVMRGRAYRIR
ncbi:MAG TPA: hypothetical protein VHU19_00440 [Pyrinomonadaceae bacterium]|jgi:hypothetical protein|nr:hypothetical protein [Pyrinomonadaceae bacterium]